MFKREILDEQLLELGIEKGQLNGKIYQYRQLILEWNNKINLTAITDEEEMYIKHFIDSYYILKTEINLNRKKILDIGTGAGFPGIPLALLYPESKFTLMDSLNKRINFLQIVKDDLQLKNIKLIHGRAEDYAKMDEHRQRYDVVVSRAVAELSVLLEYALPFVKKGGFFIAYKGRNAEAEVANSKRALELLGGELVEVKSFNLPILEDERNFVIIEKVRDTPFRYPRKPGKASKNPL
jgi:16S rRNA (guanine527-N7)-methyltransferase